MGAEYHNEDFDVEAQQAARDAVMQIRLFPDLTIALRKAVGYGPHIDMLQHFVYWMHPRHPKMQQRWWMYKTYAEWHDECGLTDRQVKKGRKVLRDLGLVTEKKGPYGRVHYRVDWVELVQALSLDGINDQTDDLDVWFDDFEDDISLDGISDQGQFGHHGDQTSLVGISDQPNTGVDAGDYLQNTTLLQRAAEPALAEPAAMDRNGKEDKDGLSSLPIEDKRHSKDSDTASADTAVREVVEEVQAPPKPDDDTLLADVREILDPDSGKWWGAKYVSSKHSGKTLADCILSEDGMSDVAHSVPYENLLAAITYVRWDAEEEVG